MSELAMSRSDCERFLTDLRVAVLSVERPGRGPLATPVWYRYQPGGVIEITTGRNAHKTRLLAAAGRASLCVQREQLPYAYVTVEGPVTLAEATDEQRRGIATRYLGADAAAAYLAAVPPDDVAITLVPDVWFSADFSTFGVT